MVWFMLLVRWRRGGALGVLGGQGGQQVLHPGALPIAALLKVQPGRSGHETWKILGSILIYNKTDIEFFLYSKYIARKLKFDFLLLW